MKKLIISAAIATASLIATAQVNSPANDGYYSRGQLMYNDGNYVGCIDQMSHLKLQHPEKSQLEAADFYIAMSSAHLGKADAVNLLNQFVNQYPQSVHTNEAIITIGNILLDAENYDEALEAYRKIVDPSLDNDTRAQLHYNMAYCLLKKGEYSEATALYGSITSNKKYGNGAKFYQGYINYIEKDYKRAAEMMRAVNTAVAPANMADYYLCQIYYMQGDYGKASTTARRLLDKDVAPEFKAEAARVAGESLYHLGDDAQAIPLLRRYMEATDQPLASAQYILGVADYRSGDYAAAISNLTPVSSLDDAMGQSANLFIGQSMMQQRNYSSAMIAFEKAFKKDYDKGVQETAFYNYAVANTQGGKIPFGSSVTTFEEFLRRYPNSRYATRIREYIITGYMTDDNYPAALASIEAINNPSESVLKAKQQVLYTLGSRELAAGEAEKAIGHLREAMKLSSHNPQTAAESQLWLGEALYATGSYDEAAENYTAYLANRHAAAENRPIAIYNLAYARFSAQRYSDAATEFARFVSISNQSSKETVADAYNRLADCHYYNSDFGAAADAYNKAFQVNPATGDYALYQEALMKGLQRDHNGKIASMKAMMQRFPSSGLTPAALLEIGESYDQLNNSAQTIDAYQQVVDRYPETKQGRQAALLLALAHLNSGNRQQAIDSYKHLITAAPTSEEANQAAENLKLIMAEDGNLTEYADFMQSVPGAKAIEPTELDRLTFTAAEREYLNTGATARIDEYLTRFPEGASRATALGYAMKGASAAGNTAVATRHATEIIEKYPDNELIVEALKVKADADYASGAVDVAFETYSRLADKASTPYAINEARIGMLRSARELGMHDSVVEIADALTASSTLSTEQRSEARFTRAYARAAKGEKEAAIEEWSDLAKDMTNLNGTKAAFYIAELQYRDGDLNSARESVNKLINSDSPYDYWYARAIILLSDINRAEGYVYEADVYLTNLQEKYPGSESDIFAMIAQRLNK